MKATLAVLLLAGALAASAQTNETAALANALQLEASRATNADGFCFLSIQHPEWPPMPTSPDPKLEVFRIGVGTYLVDDATWKYPVPPPAATNVSAQRIQADPLMGVDLNTNFFREHPSQAEIIKGFNLRDSPTNTSSKWVNALNARRAKAICEAIDSIVRVQTNTNPVTR